MRLEVMLAMQPLAKRNRALAMSSPRLSTGTPTASIVSTVAFIDGVHGPSLLCGRNFSRTSRIDIENRDELGMRQLGVNPRMIAANMTDANDANPQFFHRTLAIDCGA